MVCIPFVTLSYTTTSYGIRLFCPLIMMECYDLSSVILRISKDYIFKYIIKDYLLTSFTYLLFSTLLSALHLLRKLSKRFIITELELREM